MGKLYRNDLNKYKKYFDEAARLHGVDVYYRYIIKRNTEEQSGESIYSKHSEPIIQSVIVEEGIPKINSLKQLGWFVDTTDDKQLLVDFSVNTPNLQEGCRFSFVSEQNSEQNKEYAIIKLSNEILYPTCIKCLCQPVLESESTYNDGTISYGQQPITSDDENFSFISESPETKFF